MARDSTKSSSASVNGRPSKLSWMKSDASGGFRSWYILIGWDIPLKSELNPFWAGVHLYCSIHVSIWIDYLWDVCTEPLHSTGGMGSGNGVEMNYSNPQDMLVWYVIVVLIPRIHPHTSTYCTSCFEHIISFQFISCGILMDLIKFLLMAVQLLSTCTTAAQLLSTARHEPISFKVMQEEYPQAWHVHWPSGNPPVPKEKTTGHHGTKVAV